MWGPRPTATVERGNECLDNLVKILEDRGVVVDRPTPLQWNQVHRHARLPQRIHDDLHAAPRHPAHRRQRIAASANSFRCRY